MIFFILAIVLNPQMSDVAIAESAMMSESKDIIGNPLSVVTPPYAPTPEDTILESFLEKWKPYFYFDEEENYFPSSIPYYVQHSALLIGDEEVARPGEINYETFISRSLGEWREVFKERGFQATGEFNLIPDLTIIYGEKNWRDQAVIYGGAFHVIERSSDGTEHNYVALHYVHSYPYDNPSTPIGIFYPKDQSPGWHYGDMEHVTMYLELDAQGKADKIIKMFYAAHGSSEGHWFLRDELKDMGTLMDDAHPIVYVARGTHASYAERGTHYRIVGLFNDVCNPPPQQAPWVPRVSTDHRIFDADINYGNVNTKQGYLEAQVDVPELSTTPFMQLFGLIASKWSTEKFEWVKAQFMEQEGLLIKSERMTPDQVKAALEIISE